MFNQTELINFTTAQLIELQDETLAEINETKERLANGETQTDPNTGLELDEYLWGLEFTLDNIFNVLTERVHK